ncbi:MAG: hypothetical protein HYY16_00550 [Planctomycetes bacterium]|nr:hypothetical protein [Planctomycetota bacterium]
MFPFRAAVLSSLLLPGLLVPGWAQEQKQEALTLAAKYAKGDQINADVTTKFGMDLSMNTDMGGQTNAINVNVEVEARENYTTQVLAVSEKGEVDKELREYAVASATTKTQVSFGEQEQDAEPNKETSPLEGETFELTREEDGVKVVPKGSAKDVPKSVYRNLTLHQGVEILLPEKPVAKGDQWSVQGKNLKRWLTKQMQGMKVKDIAGSVECTLKTLDVVDGKRIATIGMTFDLEVTADATGMGGGGGDDEDEDEPAPKMKAEMTLKIQKGKGEVHFDVDAGQSVSLDMQGTLEMEMSQAMGDMEMTGKGKGSIETAAKWKLEGRAED